MTDRRRNTLSRVWAALAAAAWTAVVLLALATFVALSALVPADYLWWENGLEIPTTEHAEHAERDFVPSVPSVVPFSTTEHAEHAERDSVPSVPSVVPFSTTEHAEHAERDSVPSVVPFELSPQTGD